MLVSKWVRLLGANASACGDEDEQDFPPKKSWGREDRRYESEKSDSGSER